MITILHGANPIARSEALAELLARESVPEEMTTRFGSGTPLAQVVAACQTIGLFSERRIVIAENLLSERPSPEGVESVLLGLLDTLPESSHLILLEAPLPNSLVQQLRTRYGAKLSVCACTIPRGDQIVSWVMQRSQRYGVHIEPGAAHELVTLVAPLTLSDTRQMTSDEHDGRELLRLDSEIAKLATAAYPESTITVRLIRELVTSEEATEDWELIDALTGRDQARVLREVGRSLRAGTPPEVLVARLASHFEAALAATARGDFPVDEVARKTGLPPKRIAALRRSAHRWPPEHVARGLRLVRALDAGIKHGLVRDTEGALLATLLDLCRTGQ